MSRICFAAITLSFLLNSVELSAQVLHHWSFAPGDQFLSDSVGGVVLAPSVEGKINEYPLPNSEAGAFFPKSFASTGANTGALELTDGFPEPTQVHGLRSDDSTTVDDDFTIELFAHLRNISAATTGVNLAAQAIGRGPVNDFSWTFMVRNNGTGGSVPRELVLIPSDGSAYHTIISGIVLENDTDYYLASSFDLEGREIHFYAHDLTTNTLRTSSVPHDVENLNPYPTFLISGDEPRIDMDGLLDEVRLSKGITPFNDLLVNDALFSQPPSSLEIQNAPRAIYTAASDQDVRDMRMGSLAGVGLRNGDDTRILAKFDLPPLPAATERLESAKLRFYLRRVNGEMGDVAVWHSADDNSFEIQAADYDAASYTDTAKNIVTSADLEDAFYEVDVTDRVLTDYMSDGDDSVSAFRLQLREAPEGDLSEYRFSMHRIVAQQPYLVLTFVPEPTSGVLMVMGAVGLLAATRRRNAKAQRRGG